MSNTAFKFRMPAGFAGDANRTHPVTIEPTKMDADLPVLAYGHACVVDATSHNVRRMQPGDDGTTQIYGISVRPYPIQQESNGMTSNFGGGVPPTTQPLDVLRAGYVMANVVGDPVKGGIVYVWVAASAGDHVQGGFEAADDGANTIALTGAGSVATFNGPADENGVTEIIFNV